jgi:DNA-directed RNA polymerase-4 subunit 1
MIKSLFPLSYLQVFHMLKQLDPELIHKFASRRALLFLSCLPVTPNCHRVAEMPYGFSDGPRLTYVSATSGGEVLFKFFL